MKYYIPDTNSLLAKPSLLTITADDVSILVPDMVVKELSSSMPSGTLYNSLINTAQDKNFITVPKSTEYQFLPQGEFNINFVDNSILDIAKDKSKDNDVTIITNDKLLSQKSKENGLKVLTVNEYNEVIKKSNPSTHEDINNIAKQIDGFNKKYIFTSLFFGFLGSIIGILVFTFFPTIISKINVWGTIIVIILSGVGLYFFRSRKRLVYGLSESIFGLFISLRIFYPNFNISTIDVAQIIQVFGGLYVMVRGLDNVSKGLERTKYETKWKRIFHD